MSADRQASTVGFGRRILSPTPWPWAWTLVALWGFHAAACTYSRIAEVPQPLKTSGNLPISGAVEANLGPFVTGEVCRSRVFFWGSGKASIGYAMQDALSKSQGSHTLFNPIIEKQMWEFLVWGKRCVIVSGQAVQFVVKKTALKKAPPPPSQEAPPPSSAP
ncbi:MAG: hypothetical protein HYY13_03775 [Nitrospirae bacterium]|nr:hypothetical protein [Nitrospirota bacterium]